MVNIGDIITAGIVFLLIFGTLLGYIFSLEDKSGFSVRHFCQGKLDITPDDGKMRSEWVIVTICAHSQKGFIQERHTFLCRDAMELLWSQLDRFPEDWPILLFYCMYPFGPQSTIKDALMPCHSRTAHFCLFAHFPCQAHAVCDKAKLTMFHLTLNIVLSLGN